MKKIFLFLIILSGFITFSFGQATKEENYHLLIFKGSIEEVKSANLSFKEKHPDIKTFLTWESPYACLCAGICGKKEDAFKLQELLMIEYPHSVVKICDKD